MSFVSPLWLIGLVPWFALAVWILRGRPERAGVPFLKLWQNSQPRRRRRHRWQRPPLPLVLALGAVLAAILAAAGPVFWGNWGAKNAVTLIVDRGLTMSAGDAQGKRRFVEAAEAAQPLLRDAFVELRTVPARKLAPSGDWVGTIGSLPSTGIVNDDELIQAIHQAMDGGPVVVISDRKLPVFADQVIQIVPGALENVGIDSLAVHVGPTPQAMVRVGNHSPLTSAVVMIHADELAVKQQIDLPAAGEARDYFIDLPRAPSVVVAQIDAGDAPAPNHLAAVVADAAWPALEARSDLPPELLRMMGVYTRLRPGGAGSRHVSVVNSSSPAYGDAIVPDEAAPATDVGPLDQLVVAPGPLKFAGVDWKKSLKDAQVIAPPAGDWTPVVSVAGKTLAAVQTQPHKRVWVGFRAGGFPRLVDYVEFWNAVFDWLGDGGPSYVSRPAGTLVGNWQSDAPTDEPGLLPGLYRDQDGTLAAVNAPAVSSPLAPASDWQTQLRTALAAQKGSQRPLTGEFIAAAVGLLGIAAVASRSNGRGT